MKWKEELPREGRGDAYRVALALLLFGGAASAQTRLAIVAGRNDGATGRVTLRYAETDAARVRRALIEVSQVAEPDVKLLKAVTPAQLAEAFAWAKARTKEVHATPGQKTLLFVYLSAHGHDGKGLELGDEVLDWQTLKEQVRGTGADVKLSIVDACNASGVLEASAKSSGDFALKAEDRLTVEGEAWVTSSAENEPSIEAGAWRGSVFTHHLVAGLRGAADRSADRKVSLEELYRYAFERTTAGDSGQHPGYAFRLAGYGELMVSDPGRASAIVTLPSGLDAVTVTDSSSGDNVAEARRPLGRLLGFSAGRFDVRLMRGASAWQTHLELERGQRIALDESQLDKVNVTTAQLVRLSAKAPCLDITVPRPDPRLLALKSRLQGSCEKPVAATLGRAGAGRLELKVGGKSITAATDDELVNALETTAL